MASTNDGFIRVFNNGAFVARFIVSYYLNGKLIYNTPDEFAVLTNVQVIIPADAKDVTLEVQIAMTFLGWRTIYRKSFNIPPQKCFSLTGVTVYANCDEIACPSGNIGEEDTMPNNCCCCCCCCKSNSK